MRKLKYQAMVDIVNGGGLLGAGGGGSIKSGLHLVDKIKELEVEPTIVDLEELDNNKTVAAVAGMGAPKALLEKSFDIEAVKALQLLEETIDSTVDVLIPVETGAFNTVVPIYVGAKEGRPIVDADGAGRAVPELEQLMFHFYDILPSPFAIADKGENSAVIYTQDSYSCENLARSIISALGMSGGIASYVMSGKECKRAMLPGTISKAEEVGAIIRKAKERDDDFIKHLVEMLNGYELIRGKIISMSIETREGFDFGRCKIAGLGGYNGEELTIDYKNENMIARKNGKIVAMVPDLICTISLEGQPLTNADLEEGLEIAVLGFPCHEKWRELDGYSVFKHVMEKLDYYDEYKSIEELNS